MLSVILAGCISPQSKPPPLDAGIYKSIDQGEKWTHNVGIAGFPKTSTLAGTSILGIYFDPSDPKTIYLTTENRGIVFSYNSGESWYPSVGLNKGSIQALAIHPKSKCIIYAATNEYSTILKTNDCGRSWERIYYSTVPQEMITSLAILPNNPDIVYAASSLGYLYKSMDQGLSWHRLNTQTVNSKIIKIFIDPFDNNIIYLPTEKRGIFKTSDGGLTGWDKPLVFTCQTNEKECKNNLLPTSNNVYRHLFVNPNKPNNLIYASNYGIIQSDDGGQTWSTIMLLNPTGKVIIKAFAVNPVNNQELYYVTNTTFYRSADGGKNWATKKLPTAKSPSDLQLDPVNDKTIYLTFQIPSQK